MQKDSNMKLALTGIFLASSAAPAALVAGFYAFRHLRWGIPGSIDVSSTTAAILLALAFFVFFSGLALKSKTPTKPISGGNAWEKQ